VYAASLNLSPLFVPPNCSSPETTLSTSPSLYLALCLLPPLPLTLFSALGTIRAVAIIQASLAFPRHIPPPAIITDTIIVGDNTAGVVSLACSSFPKSPSCVSPTAVSGAHPKSYRSAHEELGSELDSSDLVLSSRPPSQYISGRRTPLLSPPQDLLASCYNHVDDPAHRSTVSYILDTSTLWSFRPSAPRTKCLSVLPSLSTLHARRTTVTCSLSVRLPARLAAVPRP
jgi:hypothetical protein